MVTRGIRSTPYQDPRVVISPATIVIIPEYKEPLPATVEQGITLFTVHVRRGYPDVQDPKLNSHSKLNCITACIQAAQAGRRRGADARSARLRRHLQLDPFLHRPQRRGVDLDRRLLPRRDHPRQRDPDLPRAGHPGVREEFLADRRLWRRGGVRHRHLRRRRAGARRSTGGPSPTAAGRWSSGCSSLYRQRIEADVAGQARP